MAKKNMDEQSSEKQNVVVDDGFIQGEAYPNCEGQPCDSVTYEEAEEDDISAKLAVEAAEWKDRYLRLSAEFDNYRKRTLKEKMDLVSSGCEDTIKAVLPVADDFDRALKATENAGDVEAIREGVVLIASKLRDVLRSKGVEEIPAMGLPLDTDMHEAVAKIPVEDKSLKGKIVDVVLKGYRLGDKVIRHSKVVVGE